MKIAPQKIETFVRSIDKSLAGMLLYGPEPGLADERFDIVSRQIAPDQLDPFLIVEISMEKIKEDPAILSDEVFAMSFSKGRKLIKIKDATDGLTATLKDLFANEQAFSGPESPFILISAGELGPRSSLRLFFEAQGNVAAIPCYRDDYDALVTIVRNKLREKGYNYEDGVPQLISQNSLGNRMILSNEIEKLSIYLGERKSITLDDVKACVVDTAESSIEDLCMAVADGNNKAINEHFDKAILQGIVPISMLRSIANYFFKLQTVYGKVAEGMSEQEAINSLRPPVFFKHVPTLRRHLSLWRSRGDRSKIDDALKLLYNAELESKKSNINPLLSCRYYLDNIAKVNNG